MVSVRPLLHRLWAAALGALLIGGPLGPLALWHAASEDDRACGLVAGSAPDVAGARVGRAGHAGASAGGHCAVCHWLSSLRPCPAAADEVSAATGALWGLDYPPPCRPADEPTGDAPARAPPRVSCV